MKSWLFRTLLVPCLGTLMGVVATPARAADDAAGVFKLIPAESLYGACFVNLEKFDKSVTSFVKRIDPDGTDGGILADLKSQVPVAEWIDFSKPVGMAVNGIGEEPILWARIADFDKKIKEMKNATEEGGIWHVEKGDDAEYFLKQSGDYVVIAGSKAQVEAATKSGKNMAELIGSRMPSYDGKEVVMHVNFEPMRAIALGQLAQGAQMVPMLAMMAGPQMGVSDPTALTGVFTALLDGVKSFVEQIDYLEVAASLDEKNADIALVTGYKEGAIRSYLNAQKPASIAPFDQIEEQPFVVAASYHFPAGGGSIGDYLLGKMQAAMPAPAAGDAAAGANDEAAKAIKLARELYSKIDGQNMVMNMSVNGMQVSGDYIGKDAAGILNLQKEVLTKPNALQSMFDGGVKYEAGPAKKVESTELHTFTLKFDPASPAAASAAKMYPKDAVQAYGIVGDRVRFALGSEKDLEKAFASKITKPLSSSPRISEALASMPSSRNAILLVDLAGLTPIIAAMSGNMPEATAAQPGPPIAISVSMSGGPARADIRVPLKAIERMVQQFSPKQPT